MAPQLSRNRTERRSFVRRPGSVLHENTAISVPDIAPPPLRRPTRLARGHTLSRPERGHGVAPMLNPDGDPGDPFADPSNRPWWRNWWRWLAMAATFWAPPPLLTLIGLRTTDVRQAWREKVTLVLFSASISAVIAFITLGLQRTLCHGEDQDVFENIKYASAMVGVLGHAYNASGAKFQTSDLDDYASRPGLDLTQMLDLSQSHFPACDGLRGRYAEKIGCVDFSGKKADCIDPLNKGTLQKYELKPLHKDLGYDWSDLMNGTMLSIDGTVLNFQAYLENSQPDPNDPVDKAIRYHLKNTHRHGADATRVFATNEYAQKAIPCLKERYAAGRVNYKSSGCFMAELILYLSLIIIIGLVAVRTIMAIWFAFVGALRLSRPPPPVSTPAGGARRAHSVSPSVMPAEATPHNDSGMAPWANKQMRRSRVVTAETLARQQQEEPVLPLAMTAADIGNDPFIVCLVTCYSEGLDGVQSTLESLSATEYPSSRKLIFIVADGMVTGAGESMSTPDVCVSLLCPDSRFGTPTPMSYRSVAQGKSAHNMALAYAGHYLNPAGGEPTAMIVVAKCGTPDEASAKKPGNRGKRDSQMVLMNFFQRVTYNDPMTPLDYDLFRKIHALMGVTPDFFELCLMVDADTRVFPSSLRYMANGMLNDHRIMGLCGETRITNKAQSWVTAIQVFEYFISHHQIKAFESVFGGVTCLPGCFSMYRIKARKPTDSDWIPVLVKPEIIREYSQSTVTTLHQKNLLLLGEDRFLSTLMLRTFPHRRMVFIPQAVCQTEVPHKFRTLLSQRRRWINSTVHNLMELVLVRDLCGTFCFSMQFVVLMDLIGTLVLPVAIILTYILVILTIVQKPESFSEAIPIVMLLLVLVFPGVIITCTRLDPEYFMWLFIYLVFLPVWNLILPTYSFWHFDDFSWGETRKVEGESKGEAHGVSDEEYNASLQVPMRLWSDWERSRIRKQHRDERRRREMENQFGARFYNDGAAAVQDASLRPNSAQDDADSLVTADNGDIDRWGDQIGTYDETDAPPELIASSARPVSVALNPQATRVLGEDDMEDMLQKGWDDDDDEGLSVKTRGPFINVPNHSVPFLSDPLSASSRTSVDANSLLKGEEAEKLPTQGASSAVVLGHTSHARNRSYGGHRFDRPYDASHP